MNSKKNNGSDVSAFICLNKNGVHKIMYTYDDERSEAPREYIDYSLIEAVVTSKSSIAKKLCDILYEEVIENLLSLNRFHHGTMRKLKFDGENHEYLINYLVSEIALDSDVDENNFYEVMEEVNGYMKRNNILGTLSEYFNDAQKALKFFDTVRWCVSKHVQACLRLEKIVEAD